MQLVLSFGFMGASFAGASSSATGTTLYVAPAETGKADGLSREDAASYTNEVLWGQAGELLKEEPVTVNFADGLYTAMLALHRFGDDKRVLTLQGESPTGVVFNVLAYVMIELKGCQMRLFFLFPF